MKTISYKYYCNFEAKPTNIEIKMLECLETLSMDLSIIITRPDKGYDVVLLNKADYIKKMEYLLQAS